MPQIVRRVVREETQGLAKSQELEQWKNEILTSDDKVVKKLDQILGFSKTLTFVDYCVILLMSLGDWTGYQLVT